MIRFNIYHIVMNKALPILTLLAASSLAASAYDFGFLTFTDKDGNAVSIPTETLEICYSDGMLTARSGETTLTLPTTSLAKMAFTEEGVTNAADIVAAEASGPIQVFSLEGISLGTFNSMTDVTAALAKGNYIMIINGKAIKTAL